VRFSCRSALVDVVAGRRPKRLAVELDVEGANTRLVWIAAELADGGRIAGARRWSSARWYSEAGFHPRYMLPRLEEAELVRWDGDDLVVLEYVAAHENRLRYLRFVQIPAMMEARGFDPTHYGGTARPSAPPSASTLGVGYDRVNCAKVLKAPTTEQSNCAVELTSTLNPDPRSAPRRARVRSPLRSDPDPPLTSDSDSEPPEPLRSASGSGSPEKNLRRATRDGADTGPEGFEAWVSAMPIVRPPRSAAAAQRWREENLEFWVQHDLEGEADEILAEVELCKGSEKWTPARYIPSPINFLRAASWRRRAREPAPKVWGAPEVFGPAPTWRPPEHDAGDLNNYLNSLAAAKVLS
jgi:hypothetical protein